MKKLFLTLAAAVVLSSCATTEKALFDGYPDDLPPVPEERLQEILADIVERENRIVTEEESDIAFVDDGYTYLHSQGNTYLVDTNETSPFNYHRIRNSGKEIDVPNFIYVVYGRPTKENMRTYSSKRNWAQILSAKDFPRFDDIDYSGAKSQTISLYATVEIGGETYEVMFTDIDDD